MNSSPFAAAIVILRQHTKEDKWVNVGNLKAAIRVLEAAGKVDKERALIALTWIPSGTPEKFMLRGVVLALPEKEEEEKGCPNPEAYPKISVLEEAVLAALPDPAEEKEEKDNG